MALSLADKIELAMAKVRTGQAYLSQSDSEGNKFESRSRAYSTDPSDPWKASGGRTVHRSPSPGQNGLSENANQEHSATKLQNPPGGLATVPAPSSSSTENTQPETKNINNSELAKNENGSVPSHSAPLSDKLDISGKNQENVKASNQEGKDIPPPPPASLANTNDSHTLSSPPVPPSSVITAPIATPTSTKTKAESNQPEQAAQNGQKSSVKFQNTGPKNSTAQTRSASATRGRKDSSENVDNFIAAKQKLAERRSASASRSNPSPSPVDAKLQAARKAAVEGNNNRASSVSRATSRDRGTPVGKSVDKGQQLYDRAKEQRERAEQRRLRQSKECTFEPTIFTKSSTQSRSNSATVRGAAEGKSRFEMLYQNAQSRSWRIEQQRQKSDPAETFAPQITAKAKSSSSTVQRFELLYNEAQRRKERQGELIARAEEECTFTPEISKTSRTLSEGSEEMGLVTRLYDRGVVQKKEQEKKRMEMKDQMELKDCTFAPSLKSQSRSASRGRSEGSVFEGETVTINSGSDQQIQLRLAEYEEIRQVKMEALRKEIEEKEAQELRFAPDLSLTQTSYQPKDTRSTDEKIYERLHRLKKSTQREEAIKALKEEQDKELTFKPHLPARAASATRARSTSPENGERSASAGRAQQSAFDRLYREGVRDSKEFAARLKEQQDQELKECTFKPTRIAADLASKKLEEEGKKDVPAWKRLSDRAEQEMQKELWLREQAETNELAGCTFSPRINQRSIELSASVLEEKGKVPVHERLLNAQPDFAAKAKLKENRELEGCTFRPSVRDPSVSAKEQDSIVSSSFGSARIAERLYSEALNRQKKNILNEKLKMERETEHCTFTPEVKGFVGLTSSLAEQSSTDRLFRPVEVNLKRAEIEAKWRMEQQYKEKGSERSRSAQQPRSSQPSRGRQTSSRERGTIATPERRSAQKSIEEQRSKSANRAATSSQRTNAKGAKEVAADFEKWQASIEQQINAL